MPLHRRPPADAVSWRSNRDVGQQAFGLTGYGGQRGVGMQDDDTTSNSRHLVGPLCSKAKPATGSETGSEAFDQAYICR